MQVTVNSNKNSFHKVLVKITCLEWIEKEIACKPLETVTPKDIIKCLYY